MGKWQSSMEIVGRMIDVIEDMEEMEGIEEIEGIEVILMEDIEVVEG